MQRAERWMLDRFVDSDGLGAIFPPIVWSRIALECLGYDRNSAEVRYCDEQLNVLIHPRPMVRTCEFSPASLQYGTLPSPCEPWI